MSPSTAERQAILDRITIGAGPALAQPRLQLGPPADPGQPHSEGSHWIELSLVVPDRDIPGQTHTAERSWLQHDWSPRAVTLAVGKALEGAWREEVWEGLKLDGQRIINIHEGGAHGG